MEMQKTKDAKNAPRKRWPEMDGSEKSMFVLKICVMVMTGGFVFANVVAP